MDQPITLEIKTDRQSNPSDLAALGHLPLHKGGFGGSQPGWFLHCSCGMKKTGQTDFGLPGWFLF